VTLVALGLNNNTKPYTWTYANAAARTGATGFVAADVGSWAVQLDDGTLWELTATTPTWAQRAGGTVTAHATSHQVGGSDAFTGIVPASAFAPSGLTGATAASRYVGATTGGAPASGTFAVGDVVIDQTGKVWVCTTAGTPGTWTQVGPGGGASARYVRSAGSYTTTSTTFVDVDGTNMSLTITTGARRVNVGLIGTASLSVAAGNLYAFDITVDGTRQGGTYGYYFRQPSTATYGEPVGFIYPTDVLSAGSHTFKLQWRVLGATTATLFGDSSAYASFFVEEVL
jgi:hypothetical protein